MAKKEVKCLYCGQVFDRNQEEYVKPNATRYAHKECYENRDEQTKEKENFNNKVKEYLGEYYEYNKVKRQLDKYVREGYELPHITRALEYFYDVQKNDAANSNGGIGIIPHIYEESISYWKKKESKKERYKNVKIEQPKDKVVKLKRQKVRKPLNIEYFELK